MYNRPIIIHTHGHNIPQNRAVGLYPVHPDNESAASTHAFSMHRTCSEFACPTSNSSTSGISSTWAKHDTSSSNPHSCILWAWGLQLGSISGGMILGDSTGSGLLAAMRNWGTYPKCDHVILVLQDHHHIISLECLCY